ncbi:MAG: hypothetical protein CMI12_06145 [Oceanospirillum sp.]|nr:hypothetical protein [Oceanospirillum sp.]
MLLYRRQQGMATLTFSIMLLLAITSVSFLTAKTLLTDQKIASNDYRAKELAYASEAALEYGLAWLNRHQPDFEAWNTNDEDADGQSFNDLNAPNSSLTAAIDSYILTVSYRRRCISPDSGTVDDACGQWLIQMSTQASASSDHSLSRSQVMLVLEDLSNFPASTGYIRVPGSWQDW